MQGGGERRVLRIFRQEMPAVPGLAGERGRTRSRGWATGSGVLRVGVLAQVQISCFLFSYLVCLGCEVFQVLHRRTPLGRWLLVGFTAAGLVAHTAYLMTRFQISGMPPLMSSGQDWLLVLAWLGVILYLVLLLTLGRLAHGLFLLPAILLLVIVALFVSSDATGDLQRLSLRRWGMLHAASLVLGMALVLGAVVSGVMYLIHHQKLRGRAAWLRRLQLPSLEQLTAVNRWTVILSVPCLTVGLITGFVLLVLVGSSDPNLRVRWSDPTILTTIAVWCAMVGMLLRLLRHRRESGKRVAQMSLLSGGFLLVAVLGPMLLAEVGGLKTFHGSGDRAARDSSSAETVRSAEGLAAEPAQ